MPSIQGGGANYFPPQIQPQRQVQQAAQVQAEQPQTVLAPKDTVKMQAGPSQTSLSSQIAQRLTSDTTKAQIHQLIQRAEIQVPAEKPQLQMMQKPAMGSALAEMLQGHHVPEQTTPQQQAQQQAQQAMQQPSQQGQAFAAQQQTSTFVRLRDSNEDAADRNSLQSGKRVRKEEKEGEFDSLEDFGGSGMSGQQGGQDQRSDSQKKKQLLTLEERRKAPPGAKPTGPLPPPKPPVLRSTPVVPQPPKPPAPKPASPKPAVQRVQPPLGQQLKPAPPKKSTDEWTI